MPLPKGNIPWNKELHGKEYMKHFKAGHPMKGMHHSAESIMKMRLSHLGKKSWCKGLTKKTDKRLEQSGIKCSKTKKLLYKKGIIKPWNIGIPMTDEHKKILLNCHLGIPLTEKHKKALSKSLTGKPAWNKGLKGKAFTRHFKEGHAWNKNLHGEKLFRHYKNKIHPRKGKSSWCEGLHGEEFKKHFPNGLSMQEKHHSQKSKILMSQNLKGHTAWSKGLTKQTDKRLLLASKKMSKIKREMWKNPEFAKRISKNLHYNSGKPTKLELDYKKLFEEHSIKLTFVGNKKLFIEGKCPDFINETKKIIVEVRNTRVCKIFNNMSFQAYKKERTVFFKQLDYKCLVFSEKDLKSPEKIITKLGGLI